MTRALVFVHTLALLCVLVVAQEYEAYDGWRNNIQRPASGAADTNFLRKLPNSYSDHTYELITTRPNPRNISNLLMSGATGLGSYLNRTTMLVFFGYQIVGEILDGQIPGCPVEYINIPVPACDTLYDPECSGIANIPLVRGRYDRLTGQKPGGARQMLNSVTPWLDGSSIYGTTKFWSNQLRTFQGGLLATSAAGLPDFNTIGLPFPNPPAPRDYMFKQVQRLFKIGNERGDENPMLLSLSIMWLQNHNYYANQIATANPTWNDEQIFNKARQYNIAVLQHLVLERWLPAWLNQTIPPYTGYDADIDPGISVEFAAAAMRWGHTLVPPGQYRRTANCIFQNTTAATVFPGFIALRTCNTYWNAQEAVEESGIAEILMGMASQIAEREDNIIADDLRQYVHGPLEQVRRDLMAINIQRGRDYGLTDFNTARVYYGLAPYSSFNQINPDPNIFNTLASVYNNDINNIDIWTGGLLESGPTGPGPLFSAIILEQFLRLRDGDRWWYNNSLNGLFSTAEIEMIQETEMSTVIYQATGIAPGSIQLDVFHHNAGDVCPQPKQLAQTDMEPCTAPRFYDYFSISTVEYPFIAISAGIFMFMLIGLMFLLVRYKSSFYPKEKTVSFQIPADQDMDGTMVFGALSLNKSLDVLQTIKIKIDKTSSMLVILAANGKVLREVSLKKLEKVESSVKDTDLLMIKVPREYDLFLKFATQLSKERFYDHLLKGRPGLAMDIMTTAQLMKTMKTKEARKAEIQQFFGKLIERVFNNKGNPASGLKKDQSFRESDIHGLSLDEFAEIFELPRNSLFVAQLFKYANKNQDGNISPQEFFQLLALFSRKSPKDKIKFMFEIYDVEGTGRISRENFTAMFMSTLEMNNQGASKSNIEEVIESMYRKAGLKSNEDITFEAFKLMVGDYSDLFQLANLGGKNAKGLQRGGTKIYGDQGTKDPKKQLKRGQSVVVQDKAPQELTAIERFQRYVFDHRLEIFWLTLFYLALLGIATERIYSYSFEREYRGLRRIAGYGISTTRGAASAMMFSFSIILLSICRNLMAILRNTFLRKFIPFDAADEFHIICGLTSFVVVAIHVTGHLINFFSIATEPTYSLACLFREVTWPSDYLPAFSWWVFKTPTGVSGFVVTYICVIMAVFSVKYFRSHFFVIFKIIHQSCAFMIYCLMLMHGWAQLVQVPIFHTYLIGPLFLYMCDLLISISKRAELMEVTKTEWLPSDVLMLQFEKPKGLDYKAGQWLRIASIGISRFTFHPFTITSAPHEKFLSVHIRAVGPWTRKMREIYNPQFEKLPPVVFDGPFGAATDGWHSFSHVIFVGAGIGVTPFASILKNFVYMAKNNAEFEVKKVIFFWVCRSQRQFEWLVDIIREAEAQDVGHRLEVHIFVTELNQKFDLRTIMLYIAEKQFYKVNGASLFTGLQASTHFGRPDFEDLFKQIQVNVKTDQFAVFSCAPRNIVNDLQDACDSVSRRAGTQFRHFDDSFI